MEVRISMVLGKRTTKSLSGSVLVRPDDIVVWRWMDLRRLKEQMNPSAELGWGGKESAGTVVGRVVMIAPRKSLIS